MDGNVVVYKGQDHQPVALRGSTVLSELDLRGHLASLFELPNIGVLLGAGASKIAGCKTMAELRRDFEQYVEKDDATNREAERLKHHGINFEDIESAWSTLTLICELSRFSTTLLSEGMERAANRCIKILLSVLLKGVEIDVERANLSVHRKLLQKLVLSRQPSQPAPWVFTTNYDLLIEFAAEQEGISIINGFSGLHTRSFSPSLFDLGWYSTAARGEARFGNTYCYLGKLHGSLSWVDIDGTVIERPWSEVKRSISEFIRNPADSEIPNCLLCPPSSAKYVDTIGFVQGELFRRFAEFVERPNTALLVCGYSFRDRHLDRLLMGALRNPTFHLVMCLYDHKVENNSIVPNNAVVPHSDTSLSKLASFRHPNITWVCSPAADFGRLVDLLPDPVLIDEEFRRTQVRVRDILRAASNQAT